MFKNEKKCSIFNSLFLSFVVVSCCTQETHDEEPTVFVISSVAAEMGLMSVSFFFFFFTYLALNQSIGHI